MRRRLIALLQELLDALRGASRRTGRPARPRPGARPPAADINAADINAADVVIEYRPSLDGDPDPGEVVWTWVPFEDDPSQGKDRPVVIVGRRGSQLVGVSLTSKRHDHEPQVEVGTGPWDREGRTSYAKLGRLLAIEPHQVRREGAVLSKRRWQTVVDGVERVHGHLGPRRT